MRKIVFLKGAPGSGKSHMLEQAGLEPWSVSFDKIRKVYMAPTINNQGNWTIDNTNNAMVTYQAKQILFNRIQRGETIFLDNTMGSISKHASDFTRDVLKFAESYYYKAAVVDMSHIPLKVTLERNEKRKGTLGYVNPNSIHLMSESINRSSPLEYSNGELIRVIKGMEDNSHIKDLTNWLEEPIYDFNNIYKEIIHIGDIQGCYSVLFDNNGPFKNGFDDDKLYIFLGDLLDRGIENGKVMRWFLEEALPRDNVILMHGNHEDHLMNWAQKRDIGSAEFVNETLPQLKREGLTREDADAIIKTTHEFLQYTFKGKNVFVNHAGINAIPDKPYLLAKNVYTHGYGEYSNNIDKEFERLMKDSDIFQIHGHRNTLFLPPHATPHSFNLESSVEDGRQLRTCTLSQNGWRTNEYQNYIFKSHQTVIRGIIKDMERTETKKNKLPQYLVKRMDMTPHWILNEDETSTIMDTSLLQAMMEHDGVRKKTNNMHPHVYSLNFTRDVFFNKSWDDVVVKARGLFISSETNEIVSRGYEKFNNIGEVPSTTIESLMANMKYPIEGYEKYNGFLGNMGYNAKDDTLFTASKSTPEGDFAEIFRKILFDTTTEEQREKMKYYLRDNKASFTFEVIDPVNDPHMIEYEKPEIVLLHIIKRSSEFDKASHEVVKKVGEYLNIPVKKKVFNLKNPIEFKKVNEKLMSKIDMKVDGKFIEGIVWEDANNFMVKTKMSFYGFWKQMRSVKDRVAKLKENDQIKTKLTYTMMPDRSPATPEFKAMAEDFINWCYEKDSDYLRSTDIITIRDVYQKEKLDKNNDLNTHNTFKM